MITLIIVLALLGFIVYAVVTYIPMPDIFQKAIIVIAVILAILYVMRALGFQDIPLNVR